MCRRTSAVTRSRPSPGTSADSKRCGNLTCGEISSASCRKVSLFPICARRCFPPRSLCLSPCVCLNCSCNVGGDGLLLDHRVLRMLCHTRLSFLKYTEPPAWPRLTLGFSKVSICLVTPREPHLSRNHLGKLRLAVWLSNLWLSLKTSWIWAN